MTEDEVLAAMRARTDDEWWEGAVRHHKHTGDARDLAWMLRATSTPIPDFVRDYLSDFVEGKLPARKGRTPKAATLHGMLSTAAKDPANHTAIRILGLDPLHFIPQRDKAMADAYEAELRKARENREPGRGETPSHVAAERTAEQFGVNPSTVFERIRTPRRTRKAAK